ncbi:MAG: VOC family protein [Chloroflexota bacterium]|nr:VOC family protein [Anaerolineae bacterium]HMM29688.1 VOC family protein [Aggregatilineaceae bacterium]
MDKRPIVHFEIPAQDRDLSARFYQDVFGWEFNHVEQPSPYTLVMAGNVGGGLPDVGEGYQPGDVVLYLDSDDIEADLKRIEAHGGKALSPCFPVGDFGEMAFFADPAGNRLAIYHALKEGP